jgi:2-amino-4-hydroxy-6-hydroxymethyldihydropteridine diphosphokinase
VFDNITKNNMQRANLQTVYLLLGSNLGNREQILIKAIQMIDERIGAIISQSRNYETKPWGKTDQPDFVNVVIGITTSLMPIQVLEQTQAIEEQLGRVRIEKWGARLIDIDIIFYGQEIIDIPHRLYIPHPLVQERTFALEPLAEIAPDFVHPIFGKTISELLRAIQD